MPKAHDRCKAHTESCLLLLLLPLPEVGVRFPCTCVTCGRCYKKHWLSTTRETLGAGLKRRLRKVSALSWRYIRPHAQGQSRQTALGGE